MSIEDHICTLCEYQEKLHNLGQELKDGEFAIITYIVTRHLEQLHFIYQQYYPRRLIKINCSDP